MDYAAYVLKREDNNIFLFFTREVDKFSPLHINIPYNLEIIGNIYENPDRWEAEWQELTPKVEV